MILVNAKALDTKTLLRDLNNLCVELQSTSSSNDKIAILKKHLVTNYHSQDLIKLVRYIYHPTYQFYVTSDNLVKKNHLTGSSYVDIFDLLDDLRTRKITGHDAIGAINTFVSNFPSYADLIHCIIDKDLKTRAGDKIINKVIPDLIPIFEVALAASYEDAKVDFADRWYSSQKMDGARCIVVVDDKGKTTAFSRQGKIFETLGLVQEAIESLGLRDVVFDGEICLLDFQGKESFQGIMKLIRKKDFTISNPVFKIFDLLSSKEFYDRVGSRSLSVRLSNLNDILSKNDNPTLTILTQTLIKDQKHFEYLIQESVENKWEGLILRKDAGYKGKRSKDLLKQKSFFDDEYQIMDTEMGKFRYLKEGKEYEETMLSSIIIHHKGNSVGVGSGFTVDQRQEFYKNPKKILGKIATIQYFEETKNQNGGISLRFPTFKYLHGEERDT